MELARDASPSCPAKQIHRQPPAASRPMEPTWAPRRRRHDVATGDFGGGQAQRRRARLVMNEIECIVARVWQSYMFSWKRVRFSTSTQRPAAAAAASQSGIVRAGLGMHACIHSSLARHNNSAAATHSDVEVPAAASRVQSSPQKHARAHCAAEEHSAAAAARRRRHRWPCEMAGGRTAPQARRVSAAQDQEMVCPPARPPAWLRLAACSAAPLCRHAATAAALLPMCLCCRRAPRNGTATTMNNQPTNQPTKPAGRLT